MALELTAEEAARAPPEAVPLAVIGAGAAGLLGAIFAGRGGTPAVLFETRPRPGAKIRLSGGGRCNVLPSRAEAEDFHTRGSPHALRNLLSSWPLEEVRGFFERDLGIGLKVEESGKVFPLGDDPREVVAGLLEECARAGARVLGGQRVCGIRRLAPEEAPARFEIRTEPGLALRAENVLLSTGGLSLPKTGSDGWGLALARSLGHTTLPDYPALVPLLSVDPRWRELAGVSARVRLRAVRGERVLEEREGDLLFTHRGFSGPVVLDLSWRVTAPGAEGAKLVACFLGTPPAEREGVDWDARLRQGGRGTVAGALREGLPRRLADLLVSMAEVAPERKLAELSREERAHLVRFLQACPLETCGDEGYRTAEVTGGGVPLDELSTRTLESRLVPRLFFAGEMIDVTGRIGGYNFLWAWVSGRKAGMAVAAARR